MGICESGSAKSVREDHGREPVGGLRREERGERYGRKRNAVEHARDIPALSN